MANIKPSKHFNIKIPHQLWVSLKSMSIEEDKSMTEIVIDSIEKAVKKHKKRLTQEDE